MIRCVIMMTVAASIVHGVQADDGAVTADQQAYFETHIRPVLADRCFDCHSQDNAESDLDLSSRAGMLRGGQLGSALKPGQPAASLLISAIRHDEFIKMPPKEKLSSRDIAHFTRWVEMGAPWPNSKVTSDPVPEPGVETPVGPLFTEEQTSHWSFQPVTDPAPPDVRSDWVTSPIDQFILQRLNDAGLKPAPPADRRTLIRRVTYDLTGLPPTPEETAAFLADESGDAFEKLVDRLLASPRYGEHWGRHWLDVARYADSNGLDENLSYANAWHYRDYVIRAFNSDKPYPRFVQEQIAGDLLPEVDDEQENLDRFIATGFLALGPKMLAEDDPVKMQMDIIDEQLSTLGQTFMGLTLGCARCHDHKFDPLPTEDYYSLAGIFKSSKTMENHKVVAVWYERPLVSKAVQQQIDEADRGLAAVKKKIDDFTVAERESVARHIQDRFGRYLLAAAELQKAHQQPQPRRSAQARQKQPFVIVDGAAVLEAEAFHRGNIETQTTGYGEGIGVVLSRGEGFVEYDVDVVQPGTYQLEVRFAAQSSRPVQVRVNGLVVDDAVAGQETGSWYPAGQRWFPGGQFELKEGRNTIRLQRDGVFPHIDRLVLVYHGDQGRPVDKAAPYLSEIATRYDVNLQLAEVWRAFLEQVRSKDEFPSFNFWLALTELGETEFETGAAELLESSESLPDFIRAKLATARPRSLSQAAEVFQTLVTSSRDALPQTWFESPSPLAGPVRLSASCLAGSSRQQLNDLQRERTHYETTRPEFEVAMGVTEGTPEDLKVHLRGSHIALGQVAPRRFPRIIGGLDSPDVASGQSGRLQLAQWLTQQAHPLVNRIMVNRVWHWHFGRGLSPSVDNFGLLGQAPTHPELLDWLTSRFAATGGSIKQLHRLLLLSSTYQMSSRFEETANEADPDNELLWRFRRQRLTAEQMRDSVIALGTGLDLTVGGSLLKVENRKYVTGSGTNITDEFDNHRRSVFLPVVRSSLYDVLQTFDFPDPAVAAGQRQSSIVAPQALMLMNSDLVEAQTLAVAKRLTDVTDDRQKIHIATGQILNREPTSAEFASALDFVDRVKAAAGSGGDAELRAWQSYCRVLLSSNEFAYVE